jgi:hypothetical protein
VSHAAWPLLAKAHVGVYDFTLFTNLFQVTCVGVHLLLSDWCVAAAAAMHILLLLVLLLLLLLLLQIWHCHVLVRPRRSSSSAAPAAQ